VARKAQRTQASGVRHGKSQTQAHATYSGTLGWSAAAGPSLEVGASVGAMQLLLDARPSFVFAEVAVGFPDAARG
jgi:hypothetical protein